MDWNAVALELEALAETTGINALDYVPDDLPNTAFYVGEMDIEPNQSFNKKLPSGHRAGVDQGTVTCRILVARSTDKFAVRKMRKYLASTGTTSLIEAFQDPVNQRNPEKPWSGIKVVSIRGNRLFNVGESKFYGAEIEVFVIGAA
jgi:hypothetical protein